MSLKILLEINIFQMVGNKTFRILNFSLKKKVKKYLAEGIYVKHQIVSFRKLINLSIYLFIIQLFSLEYSFLVHLLNLFLLKLMEN